jgi:hypothetical protein
MRSTDREAGMSQTTDVRPIGSQSAIGVSEASDTTNGAAVGLPFRPTASPAADRVQQHLPTLVGLAAVVFSAVYLISDVLEVAQGGFSTARLLLTFAGEAALPLFVIGLYAVQRPRIGVLGLSGVTAYAYSYVFFTSTVVFALFAGSPDYRSLSDAFAAWMTVHGIVMLLGGLAFGLAVVRARVLPSWTGICLMVGVVLVVAASGMPNIARAVAQAVPAAAFIGMGWALLGRPRRTGIG